jgi:hypothetical protein
MWDSDLCKLKNVLTFTPHQFISSKWCADCKAVSISAWYHFGAFDSLFGELCLKVTLILGNQAPSSDR